MANLVRSGRRDMSMGRRMLKVALAAFLAFFICAVMNSLLFIITPRYVMSSPWRARVR